MRAGARPGRKRGLVAPTVAMLAAFAVLVGLGYWQLQRLAWKQELIQAATERAAAPAEPFPIEADWPRLDRSGIEYRHVTAKGTFRHGDEALVFTELTEPKGPARGVGYWVMTPLVQEDGSTIIVNRGFVPKDRAAPASRAAGLVEGPVEVQGLLRWSEDRNAFTPADDPAKGEWFTRDPAAIAKARGLQRVAPFYLEAETSPPGGLPQGGETRLTFPNRHLEYALTWFGLAAALLAVYAAFVWTRRRA